MYKLSIKLLKSIALAALVAITLTSCEDNLIYDKRDDCHSAIDLRFVFDYHMEYGANAFPSNVDCVSVYVLDMQGNYIKHFTEKSEVLREENYRMHLPLDEGEYQLLVFGGLTCERPAFKFEHNFPAEPDSQQHTKAASGHKDDVKISVPLDENNESAKMLHFKEERHGGLFYGTLDITVDEKDWTNTHRVETVHMMKDTNTIQVMLQELAYPNQIDYNDYDFQIYDDNFIIDGYNNKVTMADAGKQPSYRPYHFENRVMGYVDPNSRDSSPAYEDPDNLVQIACVEFDTSRLFVDNMNTARLVVRSKKYLDDNGNYKTLIDIPFITYLAATRNMGQSWIKSDQEYLDRQSNWTMMFFLQKNVWVSAKIVVNSWIVRINNIDL